jgi:cell division protein ZapE
VRIEGPDYRHRDLPAASPPPSAEEVAARAATIAGATLDDFDGLCAHLATMHPSRYLALIDGVTAVCLIGVRTIDDQNVALRLVALTDRLYDAGIPVLASGERLDRIFGEEMLAGGFRKKYLRATSRLLALSASVNA